MLISCALGSIGALPYQAGAQDVETTTQETETETDPTASDDSVLPQAAELPEVVTKYSARAIEKWEDHIANLESKSLTEEHPEDSVLFIGSSSIRRWATIVEDIAPYHPIQRGYGGARLSDLAYFTKRIVAPHKFKAVVMFVANDIGTTPKDPNTDIEDIAPLVNHIRSVANECSPGTPFFIIEVTPTWSRWKVWNETRKLNGILREICLSTPDTYFVETAEDFLTAEKQPIKSYFVEDNLHLNETGYDLWAELIKSNLDAHLNPRDSDK